MHPRRPLDGLPTEDPKLSAEILKRAFDQVDFITMASSFNYDLRRGEAVEYESHTKKFLEFGI